jgi:hypothetical protein
MSVAGWSGPGQQLPRAKEERAEVQHMKMEVMENRMRLGKKSKLVLVKKKYSRL